MAEVYESLAIDPVSYRPILYPFKLFGRFYDITTLIQLLEAEYPSCPFSRNVFFVEDIESPTMFEREFFETVKNFSRTTQQEQNLAKQMFILFCRKYKWYSEGAALNDNDCIVELAIEYLSKLNISEAKRWGTKAAKLGNLFAIDVLGHTAMLEKDYRGAHEHFVRCWASPSWNTKDKTAYYIAECYFERDMYDHALRWANRAIEAGNDNDALTLCAQINYIRGKHYKCIQNACYNMERNMLAAFIYAMCAYRKVGPFRKNKSAHQIGSELMHELDAEGYTEAYEFLKGVPNFDAIRLARRDHYRPKH